MRLNRRNNAFGKLNKHSKIIRIWYNSNIPNIYTRC